jgi:threonine dehydrogenase-like Zn-dependent dehydrogenase
MLELALRFGATDTISVDEHDLVAAVAEFTDGRGANRVIDTTPRASKPLLDAIETVSPGGTIVLGGVKERPVEFSPDRLTFKNVSLIGAFGVNTWAYEQAMRMINSQRFDFAPIHSHILPLEGVEHGMRLLGGELPDEKFFHITIVPSRRKNGA